MTQEIHLVSYNVQNGAHPEMVLDNIDVLAQRGDSIFCLQEIRPTKGREFIGGILSDYFSYSGYGFEYFLSETGSPADLGLGIVWNSTRIQLRGVKRVRLPKIDRFNYLEKLLTPGGKPAQRGALMATFEIGDKLLRVVDIHLDWQGGFKQRRRQVEFLVDYLREVPEVDGELVCGDFNTAGSLEQARRQKEEIERIFGPSYVNAFPDMPYTMDTGSIDPNQRFSSIQKIFADRGLVLKRWFDYMFVKGVLCTKSKVERVRGSDHYPLVITITV